MATIIPNHSSHPNYSKRERHELEVFEEIEKLFAIDLKKPKLTIRRLKARRLKKKEFSLWDYLQKDARKNIYSQSLFPKRYLPSTAMQLDIKEMVKSNYNVNFFLDDITETLDDKDDFQSHDVEEFTITLQEIIKKKGGI